MEKETIVKLKKSFEESAYEQDSVEYWLARELQELLGYSDWRNFLNAVDKAKFLGVGFLVEKSIGYK